MLIDESRLHMSRTDLQDFSLLSELTERELEDLAAKVQPRTYAAHQRIFDMGEPAGGLYFVQEGKVKVFRVSPDGAEQVLGVFENGDEFALAAVFSGGDYPASAEALVASKLYFLERCTLLQLIQENPEFALRLLNAMSKKMRGLVSLIDSLSLRDARGRLSRYLASLLPPQEKEKATVELPMSKTLLSQYLGIKTETLSRTFRALVNEGILGKIDRAQIHIQDISTLFFVAGDERGYPAIR